MTAIATIQATDAATDAADRRADAERALREEMERQRRLVEAGFRDQQALADIDRARTAGVQQLMAVTNDAETSMLGDVDRVTAALEAQLATIRAVTAETAAMGRTPEEAGLISATGLEAEVAATAAAQAQIREIRAKEDAAREAEAQREIERQKEIQRAAVAAVQSSLDVMTDGFEELYDNRADIVSRLEEQLDRSEEYLTDAQREELEKRIEDQRAAARKAFEVAKAFKIAQAVIATYAAANEALASAPFPLNLVNAGLVTAAGLVNVATIASQQPAFHRGGMVDEVPINALRGEAMLSRQGRAMLGDDTINKANAGAGGTSGGTVVYQVYDRRILDRVTLATIEAGGKLDGYLRTQRSAPYGHRS